MTGSVPPSDAPAAAQKTGPAPLQEGLVRDAFQLMLGRAPQPAQLSAFTEFGALYASLRNSAEFKRSPQSQKNGLGWPEAQYFVLPDKKVMYCPIGKNACSTTKMLMAQAARHPQIAAIGQNIHMMTDTVKTGLQLSDYEMGAAQAMLADPQMLRFAVVRDPARRLLSAYIEKLVLARHIPATQFHTRAAVHAIQRAEGTLRPDGGPDFARSVSFAAFVEYVATHPAETLDPHWRPQSHYLGAYRWDVLYDMSQADALRAMLSERSGVALRAAHTNRTDSGKGQALAGAAALLPDAIEAQPPISATSFLTPPLLEKIRSAYAEDYTLVRHALHGTTP